MNPATMAGLTQDICYFCHEDVPVVAFPCRPRRGCTIKLCPACIKDFVHRGSQCPICFRRNAANAPAAHDHIPGYLLGYLALSIVVTVLKILMYFFMILRHVAKNACTLAVFCAFVVVTAGPPCRSGKWSPDAPICQAVAAMWFEVDKFIAIQ